MKYICKHITGPWKQMYKTSINFDCDINSMKENILQHNCNYFKKKLLGNTKLGWTQTGLFTGTEGGKYRKTPETYSIH